MSMSKKELVSVIIVNFNGGELLARSVRQAFTSDRPVKIIVSDNASTDNSIRLLKREFGSDERLTVIHNSSNLGFASANNVALKQAEGDHILFLNPDCLIKPDTISRLLKVFQDDEQAGMVGCRVLNPDGSEQKGCRRRVPTPWRTFVRVLGLSHFTRSTEWLQGFDMSAEPLPEVPTEVDAISGSLMLVSRTALDDVGPLDEGYFLHCEDLDWCMRFSLKGYKVLFVPDVEVIHHQGYSSKQRPIRVMWHMHKGMMRFYNKFFLRRYPWPMVIIVALGVWFRFLVLVFQHLFRGFVAFLCNVYKGIKAFFGSSAEDNLDSSFLQFKSTTNQLENDGVLVLGARSQIGHFLLPRLINSGYPVSAASRKSVHSSSIKDLQWVQFDLESEAGLNLPGGTKTVISLAPVWLLAARINEMADQGIKRLIFFSSTSRFTKLESSNDADRQLASQLAESEERLIIECQKYGVNWTLFRPTLVYGCGMDKNIFSIASFIRRFGCFFMAGEGKGCRQPVHADDLADACIKVLHNEATYQQDYNLSGGETLSYTNMVNLVFELLGRKTRMIFVSRALLNSMTRMVSLLPGLQHISPAMIERMEQDFCFDHSQAVKDFSYTPRGFLETSYYNRHFSIPSAAENVRNGLSGLDGKKVLVTGAGGFIGFSLCRYLVDQGCEVFAVLRDARQLHDLADKLTPIVVDDLCKVHNWNEMLEGTDAVVHLAGYVHERAGNLSEEARLQCTRLNIDVTRRLAIAAASAGVKRFLYVSSVKVHGESSDQNESVTEFIELFPEGSYAKSKLAAESLLRDMESSSEMEVTIVRPPLVYGPGVKANFLRLMKLVEKGIPLPLAAVDNRRSFIYLENLVDILALSIVHPDAAGQTFLVSDSEGVSTPVLINMLADGLGVTPRLFPISVEVMRVLAAVGGERSTVDRLVQSLVINSSHVRNTLGWQPPYSMEQGIMNTVYWYQQLYDPVQSSQSQLAAYASGW
jgi:nucleoside-diphosphate-sugar epimerase/GT2 family glycosyltransferase